MCAIQGATGGDRALEPSRTLPPMLLHSHRNASAVKADSECSSDDSGELHSGLGVRLHAGTAPASPAATRDTNSVAGVRTEFRARSRAGSAGEEGPDEFWASDDEERVHETSLGDCSPHTVSCQRHASNQMPSPAPQRISIDC